MTDVIRNFINGELVEAADGATTDLIDPCTGDVFATAPRSSAEDIDRACTAAQAGFEVWRDSTPGERQLALLKIADALEARADEFIAAESRNTGKPIGLTASEELPPMIDQIRFFAGAARNLEGRSAGEYLAGHTSFIRREPIGVCAQIAVELPDDDGGVEVGARHRCRQRRGAQAVRHHPGDHGDDGRDDGGVPPARRHERGVWRPRHRSSARRSRDPQLISITGSIRAGMQVAEQASQTLKRCHLELGGKAPVVVFDDADLEAAAEAIAIGGYFNAGQDCTAATRVLAGPKIYDDFVAALTEQARGTATGQPDDEDVLYGPLNNVNQFDRVSSFFDRVPDHATVQTGGDRFGDRGYFFNPTVVSGLRQDDEMVQDEIFGPVITVQRFTDEDEAVRWANGTPYGLASSVFTQNHGRAMRMSRRLDFGCVWINTHIPLVAEMPHGGFKMSGYGKDLSGYAIDDYTRIKHVMSSIE